MFLESLFFVLNAKITDVLPLSMTCTLPSKLVKSPASLPELLTWLHWSLASLPFEMRRPGHTVGLVLGGNGWNGNILLHECAGQVRSQIDLLCLEFRISRGTYRFSGVARLSGSAAARDIGRGRAGGPRGRAARSLAAFP